MRFAILVLFALPAMCADMEGWFATEGPIFSWSKSDLNFHGQLRLNERPGHVGYGRVGAVSRTAIHRHFQLVAGYYFEERDLTEVRWLGNHRIFGGGEVPYRRGRWQARGRVLLEQFLGVEGGAYKRVRERIQLGRAGVLNPYGSYEWVHDAKGVQFTRSRGGVSFRPMRRATLDISYSFDLRQTRLGGNRQFILTTVEWERRP
jgi:hypothetical protein